jgi:hypothetical protein
MEISQLQEKLRTEHGWRVGDETARYVLAMIAAGAKEIPILASDARTGLALWEEFKPEITAAVPIVNIAPVPVKPPTPTKNAGEQFLLFPS